MINFVRYLLHHFRATGVVISHRRIRRVNYIKISIRESTKMRLPPSEDRITKKRGRKSDAIGDLEKSGNSMDTRAGERSAREDEEKRKIRRARARQGEKYECRKLSILRISLVNRAFEFRSWRRARESNAATDSSDSGSSAEPRETRRGGKGHGIDCR